VQAERIQRKLGCDVLIEEFIPGREIYVCVTEIRGRPKLLGLGELVYGRLPQPQITTFRAKHDARFRKRWGMKFDCARNLDKSIVGEIDILVQRGWRRLQLSGAARFDCRISDAGELFVLECNPNPPLARREGFGLAARSSGMAYHELIANLVTAAARRRKGRKSQ
jgi:D-alanine-D-alanine ligase-like ATP-grasp enzyme